jgi:hypothetical protein
MPTDATVTGPQHNAPQPWRCVGAVVSSLCCLLTGVLFAAEPLQFRFDDLRPSWTWRADRTEVRLLKHERDRTAGRESGGEMVEFVARNKEAVVRLDHQVPPCRVLDELEASVWVRPSQPGWWLEVRVVTTGIRDPVTNQPASFFLKSDVARDPARWQRLRCRTADREIRQQLVLLRGQFPGNGDPGEMYVDQVVLACRTDATSPSTLVIDDLELSPVVPATVAEAEETPAAPSQFPPVEFPMDRIQIDGRPFFPRILRDHGETAATLAETGCNLIWVNDVQNSARLKGLADQRLWALATPPRPHDDAGDPLSAKSAGLVPFTAATDPVLCWLMGVRLNGGDRERTVDWIEQVRAADRRRNRPIMAEVTEQERLFSRDVQLLGLSRHVLQTTLSLPDYRDWLAEHRALARPGAYCWTWIQCEPSPASVQATSAWAALPQLEPEQIRLQVYAALGAGCRGIGFWTSQPVDANDPAARERFLAIKQINLELELLEPWLATVGSVSRIPCQLQPTGSSDDAPSPRRKLSNPSAAAQNLLGAIGGRANEADAGTPGLSATVLRTDYGTLVLPMWLEPSSQFVPAQAAGHNLTFVVPGAEETAAAYEVSPTRIVSLGKAAHDRKAGGRQVTLTTFDQTAIVWLTSNQQHVETMRQRIAGLQKASATVELELAKRKLDRVGQVDQQLQEVGARVADGPQIVGRAKLRLERAQVAFQSGDYHDARVKSDEALQLLRILQRLHWDDALKHVTSPVSSPYAVCFQTLPDHWRLVGHIGRSAVRDGRNLLSSGEFEDRDTLVAEGWEHTQADHEGLHASAELIPGGHKGRYALRLVCAPMAGQDPSLPTQPAVSYLTPKLHVRAGQLLHISGWVKLEKPIVGSRDGLQIHESLLGRTGALRYRDATDWTRFELLREVVTTGDWRLTMSLTGLGEARIDDLQVIALEPVREEASVSDPPVIQPVGGNGLLDRLPKLPGFSPRRRGE